MALKKYLYVLLIPWLLAIVLTGCDSALAQSTAAASSPLQPSDWPTVQPTPTPAPPTPFPKISLEPTATPTPNPTTVATSTVLTATESSLSDHTDQLLAQAQTSGGGLTSVAVALATVETTSIRRGPGASYAAIGTVTQGELVAVFGKNPAGGWLYVLTDSELQGWLPADSLRVLGSLDQAPILPPEPLAHSATASAPSPGATPEPVSQAASRLTITQAATMAKGSSPATAVVVSSSTGINDLAPVATAQIKVNSAAIRPAPNSGAAPIDTITDDKEQIAVLALDPSRSWALVKPIGGGGSGWAPIQFLNLGAPLTEIPILKDEGTNPSSNPPILQSSHLPTLQPSNPHPHLVFQLASGGDIMVINPDGSGLRRLTQGIDPALSPDGKTVAFTRWQGETGSLWLINIDGTNERQLLGFIKQAKGPEWSPDGSKIVLNFQHEGRLEDKADCSKITNSDRPPHPPQNAFDIKVKIKDHQPYFCWTLPPDPHWGLRIVNVADGSFQDLYGGQYAFRPAWDPSQSWRIVADAGNGLLETDVNRDYHQNITDQIEDGSPVFSPDGRYLAVTFGQQGGNQGYDIFRLKRDGSGRLRLTQTPLWVPVTPGDHKQWNNVSPTWSPDGSQIAFLTDRTGRWEIWVMNAECVSLPEGCGSNQHPMFSDEVNNQLHLTYNFVDERMLSWR
jgi:uncharacterized protein YgiM (DUF1202 family)